MRSLSASSGASQASYEEAVGKLRCFAGIDTHVAMVMVTEVGDFNRFGTADQFASFLGLCPAESRRRFLRRCRCRHKNDRQVWKCLGGERGSRDNGLRS